MTKKFSRKDLMKIAIEEHLKCDEYPRVGAVIAKNGVVLATGFRGEFVKMHAERVAIEKLQPMHLENSIMYTTLEPCVTVREDQKIESCADLIIKTGIKEVIIGVLDPNGTIYSQGYRKLLENDISVSFFNRKLREAVEEETFEFGELHNIIGPGKRRIPVVINGTWLNIQFSESDKRAFDIYWSTIQLRSGFVDLSSTNGAVRAASGATEISQITDPLVFRFPSHTIRMSKGMIAIICPVGATFCLLVKLVDIYEKDILFQWEMRNLK